MSRMASVLKQVLVGKPLRSDAASHTLLPKWLALPIFCSDPLSSVAYATEQIILVLVLGGASTLSFTPWVGLAVATLIVIVIASYSRTLYVYPNGGGAYAVAKDQFGTGAALIAASSLVIDYILTVAVSVTSGVANLASAFPSLNRYLLEISVALVIILTLANLRGIKESGQAFAIPTYAFIASVLLMIGMGIWRVATGGTIVAETANLTVHNAHSYTQLALVFVVLRAFASGCTALTGVEAISNGVPYFRKPKSRNAALTLTGMGVLAVTMFMGVTWLAMISQAKIADDPTMLGLAAGTPQDTIIAQIGSAVFGPGSVGFYVLQLATTFVLILAANTSYNSFPIMASVLGQDGFLPRQFGRRGDRLVFSNGVIILATAAVLLIWVYDASVMHLVQLYILGVFLSFTLSQAGMVRHWIKELRLSKEHADTPAKSVYVSLVTNTLGSLITFIVLIIVVTTKFTHGAWLVVVAIPILVMMMYGIKRHYTASDNRLAASPGGVMLPSRVHSVVLISRITAPSMQALAYARATRPTTLSAVHVMTNSETSEQLQKEWLEREIPVDLVLLDSPYRDLTGPLMRYITDIRRDSPRDIVTVFIPEYVVNHWWEQLLHNQSALRLRRKLRYEPGIIVTSVPLVQERVLHRRETDLSP